MHCPHSFHHRHRKHQQQSTECLPRQTHYCQIFRHLLQSMSITRAQTYKSSARPTTGRSTHCLGGTSHRWMEQGLFPKDLASIDLTHNSLLRWITWTHRKLSLWASQNSSTQKEIGAVHQQTRRSSITAIIAARSHATYTSTRWLAHGTKSNSQYFLKAKT